MKENDRNNNFGTLHLLAAFFVLYGHQCVLLGAGTPMFFGCLIQALGVKMIFLISGYLIMKSLSAQEGSVKKICSVYAVKRIGRLYPELAACLVTTALVIGPLFTSLSIKNYFMQGGAAVKDYVIKNLCLFCTYYLPGMFESNPYPEAVNGSLWTMPVEVSVYVIFLIFFIGMYKFGISKHVYGIFTCLVSAVFLMRLILWPNARIVFYGTDWVSALNVMPYMLVGGACYLYSIKKYLNVQWAMFLLLAAGGLVFQTEFAREAVCLALFPYIVFSLGLAEEQKLKLRFLKGEYAYGMYLWGFVVQQCLVQKYYVELAAVRSEDVMGMSAVIAVIAYVLAMVSYRLVYMPFYKWNKKLIIFIQKKL